MRHGRRRPSGFTLLEMMMVVVVIAILSVLMIPSTEPSTCEQLQATARIVATDLAYGRSLAVSNNSQYRFTWDTTNNQYILQYSGTNSALATLPTTPFSAPGDPPTQHIVNLNNLPHSGPTVQLLSVTSSSVTSTLPITTTDFGPLGGTTSSNATTIWLAASSGSNERYITLTVDPVTGLVTVGNFTNIGPQSSIPIGSTNTHS